MILVMARTNTNHFAKDFRKNYLNDQKELFNNQQ